VETDRTDWPKWEMFVSVLFGKAGSLKIDRRQSQAEQVRMGRSGKVHMTFTDFDGGHGQGVHGPPKAKKKDELLMALSTLSGPASVSRRPANSKTDATKRVPRHCLTPWQYGYFSSYCPRRCRAIRIWFDSSAVSRILPCCSHGRVFDGASYELCEPCAVHTRHAACIVVISPKGRPRERIAYDRQEPCSL
jgi:hypothetical protein